MFGLSFHLCIAYIPYHPASTSLPPHKTGVL